MKFRLLLFSTLIPVFIFSQSVQQPDLKKLDPKFISVIKPVPANQLKKSTGSASMLNSAGMTATGEEIYGAIVYTTNPDALKAAGVQPNSILPSFATVRVTSDELIKLSNLSEVKYIAAPVMEYPMNDVSKGLIGADLLQSGYINSTPYKGSGVIVGIIDTGIDWSHLDFRSPTDATKSRILYIWDQTLTPQGTEASPAGSFIGSRIYGVEYTKAHIENEIDGSPAGFVREQDINGHGTHVAGSAAGNGAALATRNYGGVAPEADLIIVKAGNGSFPENNIIDALTYIKDKAAALGKPAVVNMSLGSNYGAHDGTDSKSLAIDNFSGNGRVVVVSAGNSGDSPIHISGTIPAGGYYDLTLTVPAYTPSAGAANDYFDLDVWLSNNQAANISVTTPRAFTASQASGNWSETQTDDGRIYLYSKLDAANNNTNLFVEVYDALEASPPKNGTWTIRFSNTTGTDETFHGWLAGSSVSGVTVSGGNANYTLGNWANSAIIVGSYASRWRWYSDSYLGYSGTDRSDKISSFSSLGPTRDGRVKPDIATPGQGIISAKSVNSSPASAFIIPGNIYVLNQGTSMSSPITAGAVALLLQKDPSLSYSSASSLITSTAIHDSYTGGSLPDNTWGYGKLDIFKAMTKLYNSGLNFNRDVLIQDHFTGSPSTAEISIDAGLKVALKFTPSNSGRLTGVFFHPLNISLLTSSIVFGLWNDNGSGYPGSKISDLTSLDQTRIAANTFNFLNLSGTNANVNAAVTYHIVMYFNSGSATFAFDNTAGTGTTSINTGSNWATSSYDCRIRTVTTQDVTALPVELIAFSAAPQSSSVILKWSTATEINSYIFEIERMAYSPGGKPAWQKVGEVRAGGNSNSPKDYFYEDKELIAGSYEYRLKMVDNDGSFKLSEAVPAEVMNPLATELLQNFPNPFNPATKIRYSIASDTHVKLKIYNVLGSEVATLADGFQNAGSYSVDFNAGRLAAGVYIYKMETGQFSQTRKFVLVK